MGTKLCKSCGKELPLDHFLPKKARRGRYARCAKCVSKDKYIPMSEEEKTAEAIRHRARYKSLDVKRRWADNALKNCYARARTYKLPVDLTLEYITSLAVDVCPLLGTPIVYGQGRIAPNGPSIDRKDPKLGYVQGNLWVVSTRANRIKNDASSTELFAIASALQREGL